MKKREEKQYLDTVPEEMEFALTNDYAFKKVFGDPDNKEALTDFLAVILKLDKSKIDVVHIENPFLQNQYYDSKKGILDISLELNGGEKINIEMQNQWQQYYVERNLYYWAKRYTEDLKNGEIYRKLKPCINISILNSAFPKSDKYHSVYQLSERETHSILSNALELHFLDLTRIGQVGISPLEKWLLFIKTSKKEVREMLAKENPAMQYANETATKFYTDKEERYLYEAAARYESDKASLIDYGYGEGLEKGLEQGIEKGIEQGIEKGIEQGIEKGIKKGKEVGEREQQVKIAREMKKDGFEPQQIMKYTGLSEAEIMEI